MSGDESKEPCIDGGPDPSYSKGKLWGEMGRHNVTYRGTAASTEPLDTPFGTVSGVGSRTRVLDWHARWSHLAGTHDWTIVSSYISHLSRIYWSLTAVASGIYQSHDYYV